MEEKIAMGRRTIPFTLDAVKRAIMAVKAAGIDVRTVSVRPDGTVVINGDNGNNSEDDLVDRSQPENLNSLDDYFAWREKDARRDRA
ncbi:hypothetical protein [Martelella radicis]|uniref:Uncharacterized protein n=1 Tax=Martelella radicis TaxID=1397476 RepID=A0A7W6KIC8_9HYPH|nr:hypothetical protein [Martelella radicis]MBB4120724.1 hypothetical protein [Martelella radicis]